VTSRRIRAWARSDGVTLRDATADDLAREDVRHALRDGIERGYSGDLPAEPEGTAWYAIVAADGLAGVFALRREFPAARIATVHALAVLQAQRGHAYGARALFAVERRLARDGVREYYARVPRTNGRGLYFMLRCGYAPVPPQADDGATWFRRAA
jgi:GNAT superfamily N-acetyltransferase